MLPILRIVLAIRVGVDPRFQPSVDVPGPIAPKTGTSPTNEEVTGLVAYAHSLGMTVLLRPCVDPVSADADAFAQLQPVLSLVGAF